MDQNRPNYIHPTSRMANYVVPRFGNTKPESIGLGTSLSGSDMSIWYHVCGSYASCIITSSQACSCLDAYKPKGVE
ncbi:putative S-locus glycoprotein [Helianthus anomalus]